MRDTDINTDLADAGLKIKQLRMGKKSIFRAAKALYISINYLNQIERGLITPSKIVLHSISEYYGYDRTELFAMYKQPVPGAKELILFNSPFRKAITQISIDDRLTEEDKEYLFNEFYLFFEDLKP